ncbi:MAG: flagellar basal body rod protein FlgB [Alphaproteobacteria bacterium]|nr:flagellar basal body rod protein FlgB [Alphaproteobacteria bacterium]
MSETDEALATFMYFLTSRQEIIAENIANANTPGQISKDIKFPKNSETKRLKSVELKSTNTKHIEGSKSKLKYRSYVDVTGDIKPNGNNIDLTNEAKKGSENRIKFDTALKAYKSGADLLRFAISKAR